ncbi:SH2 domain-containing protein 4A [Pangasianodon hypophthalmus]|uniref:SH2 domain-containing protein 4A n=1 Tax=Pangasianodon hypophthalmus TaxID=310915 RepID=UPI002307DAEF|nr:SH2 domain-containing protein 4A [Pangasianodon hypophthalmus]XP_026797528.2 SH2 domain-containing protein 4A [Pangasianodon hypophthalmus]XP_034168362.2 SH2 domain-containing protein 4A [Pangasianodon hypophthalmus]XP_034168363.2 SH2 domain-containing protein 4A [Pangasianodon hypophthalmus]XP_053097232.1 SH2 domain-containing protein 4A [Pangasianodon hypophthalmus]
MLQQILNDMYIEPELLAELNEEQKQVLFFKMREEQVRRWKEREARLEKDEAKTVKPKRVSAKAVSWLKASDSEVWVWVMGEHPDDKPYDQICDEIMAERAALQAQKEAEELRAKKEAELEKRFSGLYMEKEEAARQEEARKAAALEKSQQEELKRREEEERRKAEEEVRRLKEEREQQIYMNLKEVQRQGKSQDKEEKAWQDSLRKSKAADQRRRSLAKQTREDHRRRSLKALERGRVAAMTKAFGGERPAPPPKPKPKPRNLTLTNEPLHRGSGLRRSLSSSSRKEIIRWFREEQLSIRVCFQDDDSRIAPWFHGIISRQEAEDLLREGSPGGFLVRVSERIFGYVLSYQSPDGVKHFLIDATDNCYMLLGDQIKFASLGELVEYHKEEPLTPSGGERLLHACGQKPGTLDYTDLFT